MQVVLVIEGEIDNIDHVIECIRAHCNENRWFSLRLPRRADADIRVFPTDSVADIRGAGD
jgi:hypothetical protein